MDSLDILLIIPLTWGGYNGFKKGFVVELISSFLLVFSFVKGISIFYTFLPILERKFSTLATFLPICLAILMLFIGGLVIYSLTRLIKGIVVLSLFSIFDNMLGGVFGVCKVAFFISLLMYFWNCMGFGPFPKTYTNSSLLFPLVEPIVPKILQSFASIPRLCPFK